MRRDAICVPPEMDVWSLARLFTERGITGAPVAETSGEVIGVVSQTDVCRHLMEVTNSRHKAADFWLEAEPDDERLARRPLTARDLMSANVVWASPRTEVLELSRMMLQRGIHRIIILDDRRLVGIVTTMDILKVL